MPRDKLESCEAEEKDFSETVTICAKFSGMLLYWQGKIEGIQNCFGLTKGANVVLQD